MTIKLTASHPDYPIISELWRLYAIARNPQCWVIDQDLEPCDVTDVCQTLEDMMQDILDGLPVVWLTGMARVE